MKNKTTAGILAIFLGGLGVHWFYLGKIIRGLIYLLLFIFLFWTVWVPIIIGIVCLAEGIIFLAQDEDSFNRKYNEDYEQQPQSNYARSPQPYDRQLQNGIASTPHEAREEKPRKNKTEELMELKKLMDDGILTQEEFDTEKHKILKS